MSNQPCHHDEVARLQAELARLREANREWEYFFLHGPAMQCVIGLDGRVGKINLAFEDALGYSEREFVALPIDAVVHPDDIDTVIGNIANNLSGSQSIDFEMRMRPKGAPSYRWYAWTCPGKAESTHNFHAIVRDITDLKHAAAALLHRAQHDPLTGLANRAMFDATLSGALARAERDPRLAVGLLLIDLDGFKSVNDLHGHAAGDAVLRCVSARLAAYCRKGDTACRLGGDEFAVIVEGNGPLALGEMGRKLVAQVGQPIQFGDTRLEVGCSIGVSFYPALAHDGASLLEQADKAMY